MRQLRQRLRQRPLHRVPWFNFTGSGPDKIGEFVGKMADSATGGLGATALDALGIGQGPGGQTVAKQVESAGQDIGPLASGAADIAGYAIGPGKLAVGEKLASLAGGKLLARMGGSAAEGALASGVGTLGHGGSLEDAGKAATVGALIGGATGVLPGGRGSAPTTPPTSELKTNMQNAFKPLEDTWVNSRTTGQNFNGVTSALPTRVDISPSLNGKIDEIAKEIGDNQVLSADTIARYQRSLMKATRGDSDKNVAGDYVDALNTSLGPHAPAVADANALANKYKISREIDNWRADPAGAPSAIASRLDKKPQFYPGDVGDALREIGAKAPVAGPSFAQEAGTAAAKHLIGGVTGAGIGYATGQGVPGDLAGFALGTLAPMAFSRMARIPTRNALLAAQHLNATGMKVDPGVYTNRFLQGLGVMSRQAGYGAGSAGDFDRSAVQSLEPGPKDRRPVVFVEFFKRLNKPSDWMRILEPHSDYGRKGDDDCEINEHHVHFSFDHRYDVSIRRGTPRRG